MQLWRSYKQKFKNTGLTVIILSVLALFLLMSDEGLCMFKRITGIPCAGCGMTRAFLELYKLNIAAAFSYNLLALPLLIAFIILAALFVIKREMFFKIFKIKLPIWGNILLAVILIANWIVNLIRL